MDVEGVGLEVFEGPAWDIEAGILGRVKVEGFDENKGRFSGYPLSGR